MSRRVILRVVGILLAVAIILDAAFVACFIVAGKYESSITVDKDSRVLSSDEGVRILVLSDLQGSNYIELSWAFAAAKETVRRAKPDLILTTGDNFGNDVSLRHLDAFVRFMDSFGLPWGVVFGNHDYNPSFTMEEYCEALEESENGIFYSLPIDGSYSNYSYRLRIGGEDVFSLIFMDNADSAFTENHTAWYEETVKAGVGEDGSYLPSFVFFHRPLNESVVAAEEYARDGGIGSGLIVDEVRSEGGSSGLFDKAVELGSTRAMFYGHDHRNSAHISYRGIDLCYSLKTGITVYFKLGSLGGVVIDVDEGGVYEIGRIYI
ncbi:MAG: metallophosphoesterase [Clostridia bacterium]|nr:metallophosphoesterase [Clostridia bacterium]